MPLLTDWTKFKSICITAKGLSLQFAEVDDRYMIIGPDKNGINWFMDLFKVIPDPQNPGSTIPNPEAVDFETNYKPTANGKIDNVQLDSDGAPMSRVKVAPSGWSFQLHGIEMQTSVIGSVINNDFMGVAIGDSTIMLYDAQGVLITDQPTADTGCVRTVLDFEPVYDYYVVGGAIKLVSAADQDVRAYVVGAPDVPAQFGGSKIFIQHVNLRYTQGQGIQADGRAAKFVQYNPTLHTNKLRFIFTHGAGYKINLALFLEFFKS